MQRQMGQSILERARVKFKDLVADYGLEGVGVSVTVKELSPHEAIGEPGRQDYPILAGKERIIEAEVLGVKAHSFTDSPVPFRGLLSDVLDLTLDSNASRAVFIGVMNAVLRHFGVIGATLHCRDEQPEACGREMAGMLRGMPGARKVGLIGLNPAIAERLVEVFGPQCVRITDLNADNIGSVRYGVEIWDGRIETEQLIEASDLILVTGTTLVNGTLDNIENMAGHYQKTVILFGVTAAGVSALCGLARICPYAG